MADDPFNALLEKSWVTVPEDIKRDSKNLRDRGTYLRHKLLVKAQAASLTDEERAFLKEYPPTRNRNLRIQLWMAQDKKCFICDNQIDLNDPRPEGWMSLEHIQPKSLKGENKLTNLAVSHRWCNFVRGTRDITLELKKLICDGFNMNLTDPFSDNRFYLSKAMLRFIDELDEMPGFKEWKEG